MTSERLPTVTKCNHDTAGRNIGATLKVVRPILGLPLAILTSVEGTYLMAEPSSLADEHLCISGLGRNGRVPSLPKASVFLIPYICYKKLVIKA